MLDKITVAQPQPDITAQKHGKSSKKWMTFFFFFWSSFSPFHHPRLCLFRESQTDVKWMKAALAFAHRYH